MQKRLAEALKKYPEADTNKDGELSMMEGLAYLAKMRQKASSGADIKSILPTPVGLDIPYGPHERNKLDFWKAASATADKPAPVVVCIHGGGFVGGDKSRWRSQKLLKQLLESGVSVACINYRFRDHAPVQDILHDAARAVQFIRSKSGEWNVDKSRVAAMGSSAGAGTSLWLTTRDDLADPANADPVLRESSRTCACVINATQATYDLTRWESFLGKADPSWTHGEAEAALFYGFSSLDDLKTEAAKPVLRECDMLSWISKDDGPVFATVNQPDGPVTDRGHWLHHPKHAEEIAKWCRQCEVDCTVTRDTKPDVTLAFLLKNLGLAEDKAAGAQ